MRELEQRIAVLEHIAGIDVVARLLPVLAGAFGSSPFTIAEAMQAPSVRLVIGRRSATGLGKLFIRTAGLVIAGYELEALGRHGSRVLWKVWRRT